MQLSVTRKGVAFAVVGLVGFYAACDSLVEAIKQTIVDAAIAAIEAKGGVAVLVKPGQAFTLGIDDPGNPLYGTQVELPGDSLPDEIAAALLSIEPSDFGDSPSPAQRRVGPPAEIRLRPYDTNSDSFTDERIALRSRAMVRMPYPATAVSQAEATSVVVGHLENPDDDALAVLTDVVRSSEEAVGLVAGGTLSFSPFMAMVVSSATDGADVVEVEYTGTCLESRDFGPSFDDTFDYFISSEFENGFRQVQTQYGPPPTGPSSFDYQYTWHYNAAFNVTFETEIAFSSTFGYTVSIARDGNGRPATETKQEVGFPTPSTTTYAYDAQGRLESATHSSGGVFTYTYNANGQVAGRSFDSDGDQGPTPPQCDTYTYDGNGNLLSGEYFLDCPGSNVQTRASFSDCPASMVLQHFGVPR